MKQAGDKVPSVTFHTRQNGEWADVTTDEMFSGKTAVLFALPGAFTPTCSASHLPGYAAMAGQFADAGVDAIYCLSVNDSFVMNAWAKDQMVDNEVTMVPDGSGKFSEQMGLLVNKDQLGFGDRSWRYAMLVKDGVIEKMFVEDQNAEGDPFDVSDAQTMLSYVTSR